MNISQAVIKRIEELCTERKLSINALSNISGVTQSTVNDTAVDPLKYYPELKGLLGKYLSNVSFKKEVEEGMKFKEKWQEELFIATINSLASKKKINNREDWLNKYNSGKLTAEELALLALAVVDRV